MHQYDSDVIGVMAASRDPVTCLPDVIKQESHLVSTKPCLETLTASNGYGLSGGTRDTWPSFRDGFSFSSGSTDPKMVANMAAVTSSATGHVSQFAAVDWTSMGSRTAAAQTAAGQYYASTPLAQAAAYGAPTAHHPTHHPYGWTDTGHGHAAQSAYASAYGMTSAHSTYRQSESSPTSGYPYTTFGGGSSLGVGAGHVKDALVNTPSIQDMDAERTIRRARRNRTCFSKHQMESLEEVFKESRYPDVYRREEIAATLDLKEEVVRVWFKNRRAKLKRENKDGKVTSPGSPTSTTPSPKSSTSPSFPSGTSLYSSGPGVTSYPTPTAFSALPSLKPETSYFPPSYTPYTHAHSTMAAPAETSSTTSPSLPKPPSIVPQSSAMSGLHTLTPQPSATRPHIGTSNSGTLSDHVTVTYASQSRSDVTSTFTPVKCEPTTSDPTPTPPARGTSTEYATATATDLLTSAANGSERASITGAPSVVSKPHHGHHHHQHHHHPLSPNGTDH